MNKKNMYERDVVDVVFNLLKRKIWGGLYCYRAVEWKFQSRLSFIGLGGWISF